jgi:hypothetical protein
MTANKNGDGTREEEGAAAKRQKTQGGGRAF